MFQYDEFSAVRESFEANKQNYKKNYINANDKVLIKQRLFLILIGRTEFISISFVIKL